MYYFTSRKNDYEFSFDRNSVVVAKNLGESLLLKTLQKIPPFDYKGKENSHADSLDMLRMNGN